MIRTKCEARKMRTGQNCQGECREVLGKLTYLRKSFVGGFSRCNICEYWLDWRFCHLTSGEKANSESRGMYCNCCNYQVRQKPRSREAKETLRSHREQQLSSKKDNKIVSGIKNGIRDSLAQRQKERRKGYKKILEGAYDASHVLSDAESDKHIESNHTEKSLDEIREYFKKKFQEDPSLLEEFEILENYLRLLPKNEKYSDINYFLQLLK